MRKSNLGSDCRWCLPFHQDEVRNHKAAIESFNYFKLYVMKIEISSCVDQKSIVSGNEKNGVRIQGFCQTFFGTRWCFLKWRQRLGKKEEGWFGQNFRRNEGLRKRIQTTKMKEKKGKTSPSLLPSSLSSFSLSLFSLERECHGRCHRRNMFYQRQRHRCVCWTNAIAVVIVVVVINLVHWQKMAKNSLNGNEKGDNGWFLGSGPEGGDVL